MSTSSIDNSHPQLHLVQDSLDFAAFTKNIERLTQKGDAILILNDCLYDLSKPNELSPTHFISEHLSFYALTEQIEARNLLTIIDKRVQLIDYEHFVDLSTGASKVISW